MNYIMNPQIDTSRDAANFAAQNRPNAPDASKVFDRARAVFNSTRQTLGVKNDAVWAQFVSRTYGLDADSLLRLAQEALDWALAREAEMKSALAAADAAQQHRHEAGLRAAGMAAARQAWAQANLQPLLNIGRELAVIAAEINATRGAPAAIENSFCAEIPIGDQEQLAAFVATLKNRLSRVVATVDAMK